MRQRDAQGRFVKQSALTAAATVIPSTGIDKMPRSPEGWQTRAWRLWRLLGIVHFPTSFKAKQVGRLAWNVEINGEPLDEEAAEQALEAITKPLGTQEAARRIALNLEVAGQVFYTRSADMWNVYAATTPKLKEKLKASDIIVEGLQPDPEDPTKPTSSIMAALGTAEQVRLMAALSRGQDRNRLAQRGILLVPKEGQFPEGDDFQGKLEEAMTAPIADEYAPSAVVPLKVDFPAEYIENWRHLVLESPYDDKLMERIEKAIVQFAREIDMPPEVLLGNLDSNHWNAWLSSEENYRGHIQPLGVLTGQVFAEALKEAVGASEFAGADIKVTPDPAELLSRPPSFDDALEAVKVGAVGFEYLRRVLGADDEDKPTDEDIELLLLLQGRSAPTEEEEEPPVDEAPEQPEVSPNGNGQQPVTAAADPQETELDALGNDLADIDQQLLLRLAGAADMTASQVRAVVDASDIGAQEAVASEVHRLGTTWGRMLRQARGALDDLGIDTSGEEWVAAGDRSVEVLTDGITAWLTETLERTDSEMPEVPTDLLRQALAVAGGSEVPVIAALTKPRGIVPQPTPADPMGFAVGVLTGKQLEKQGVRFTQWRFRYGSAPRSHPFTHHKAQDGRYADQDGTVAGWWPGDHRGCLCSLSPVYRRISQPPPV